MPSGLVDTNNDFTEKWPNLRLQNVFIKIMWNSFKLVVDGGVQTNG